MGLRSIEVNGIPGVLLVGYIRNDCLDWMTGSNKYVSVPEQIHWWQNFKGSAYLFYPDVENWQEGPIGYGTITPRENVDLSLPKTTKWLSGGLILTHRGVGYGQHLFKKLVKNCCDDAYLDVWASNRRAIKTYEKLGFTIIGKRLSTPGAFAQEVIYTMKKDYDPSF